MESTRRSSRSICSSVPACHPARVARRFGSRDARSDERRLVREQVRVGAHDRERRAQLVGDERDELRAGPIERDELLDLRLGLGLEAALLEDAREQVRDRGQLRDVRVAKLAVGLGLDVEHADDLVAPGERHGEHRVHEPALVDAAHPQEAVVLADVGRRDRLAHRCHPAGDPLPEGHDRAADLVAVEPVRRGEPEVEPVAVEEVERGDVRPERVAGAVDDGLEELLPRPRGRRETEELVEEAELAGGVALVRGRDLVRPIAAGGFGAGPVVERRHGEHDTSLGVAATFDGCSGVPARCPWSRTVTVACWRARARSRILTPWPSLPPGPAGPRNPTRAARFPAVAAEPPGPGIRPRARPAGPRGPAARRAPRPGHRGAGRARAVRARRAHPAAHDRPAARRPGADARARTRSASGSARRSRRWTSTSAAAVAKAFTLYFQLVNLAEERQRIRVLRTRARKARGGPIDDSVARRHRTPRAGPRPRRPSRRSSAGVVVHPVLTAHPTEARRRTLLVALRRIRRLLDLLDDPLDDPRRGRRPPPPPARGDQPPVAHRRHPGGDADAARRGALRARDLRRDAVHGRAPLPARHRPRARPRGRRRRAGARAATPRRGRPAPTRSPRRPLLRFGSWIGADRDGHPGVTSDITLHAATAPGRPPAARLRGGRGPAHADDRRARRPRRTWTARSAARSPATPRSCPRRCASSGGASPRSRTASASARSRSASAGRGRRSPARPRRASGGYADPAALDLELGVVQRGARRRRARARGVRRARGPALAGRDVRVPPRLARGPPARGGPPGGDRGARCRAPGRRSRSRGGVTLGEVLATFRAIARLQRASGSRPASAT